ncbi:MAG: hypothetical protein QW220_02205 [Candidatus Bathyarchaeia archaeon]
MEPKLIGMYVGYEVLSRGGLEKNLDLMQAYGVNTIILSGGYSVSPEVETLNPLGRYPKQPNVLPEIRRACERRGLNLWLCVGVPYAECVQKAADYPSLAVRDVFGSIIEPDQSFGFRWAASLCPSNPSIRAYLQALFRDLAKSYDLEGFTLTHLRFSPPSHSFLNLFSCFCPSCIDEASRLGYEPEKSRKQLMEALEELKGLDACKIRTLSEEGATIHDWIQFLGLGEEALRWFEFRAKIIAENLASFHEVVKDVSPNTLFSCDNYPPSFAILVGHRYRELERIGDFLSPLLNHPTIFQTLVFAEVCKVLLEWNRGRGMEEADLLRLLYGLAGYGDLGLPPSMSRLIGSQRRGDTFETEVSLPRLIEREAAKTKAISKGSKPLFVVLEAHTSLSKAEIKERIRAVRKVGVDGIFFTSFEGDVAPLEAIEEGLRD